ncbi:MAG: helix-turn-helix transcriptional regulator [Firmicutes bacterium]|nr:helix-turn-helix transcriptional regulator [Bacillota bacterium]
MNIGHHIRMRRKKLKMSQQEVAHNNWTRSYISQIESNRVQPSLQTLIALAEKLDTTVSDLIGDSIILAKAKATILSPKNCQNYLSKLHKTNTTIFLDRLTNSLLTNKPLDCQLPPNIELNYLTARLLIFQKNYHQAKEILVKNLRYLDDFWRILFLTQLSFIYRELMEEKNYQETIQQLRKLLAYENEDFENLKNQLIHELIYEPDLMRAKDLLTFFYALDYGTTFHHALKLAQAND